MTVSIRLIAVAVGAVALALSAGCGQPPEQETSGTESAAAPSLPVAPAGGVVDSSGRVLTKDLPANFPDDVPRHPDAEVIQARATGDMGLAVSLVVKDDVDTVASFYADKFASEGWTTDVRHTPEGSAVFADKGKRTAAVMVHETKRGAQVELVLGHM